MTNGMGIMSSNLRMIVFDCDGTIVDSQKALVEIMQMTFGLYNLELPKREEILFGVGLELNAGIERLLPSRHGMDIHNLSETYNQVGLPVINKDAKIVSISKFI